MAAISLRKCKRIPELVCNKDHPPFQKQGGKYSAQMPHAERCEQGLKINVLKPGVKRPPQLNDLMERKRPQVSSHCPPVLSWYWLEIPDWYFHSVTGCAGKHHTVLSPQTQSFQQIPTNPSSRWRWSRVHSNGHSMRPTTSSPHLDHEQGFLHKEENYFVSR